MEAKNQIKKKITLLLVLVSVLHGCASSRPDMYQWCCYEDMIYEKYSDPGKYSPEAHIAKLEANYEVAKSRHRGGLRGIMTNSVFSIIRPASQNRQSVLLLLKRLCFLNRNVSWIGLSILSEKGGDYEMVQHTFCRDGIVDAWRMCRFRQKTGLLKVSCGESGIDPCAASA